MGSMHDLGDMTNRRIRVNDSYRNRNNPGIAGPEGVVVSLEKRGVCKIRFAGEFEANIKSTSFVLLE